MPNRTIVVPRRQSGQTVGQLLQASLHCSRDAVLDYLRRGKVRLAGQSCQTPERRVRAGQRLEIAPPNNNTPKKKKPQSNLRREATPGGRKNTTRLRSDSAPLAQAIRVRYLDPHIVVVDKPAGLTTVRHATDVEEFGRRARKFLPPTLVDLLPGVLPARERVGRWRAVHRLDKETSGLIVLARTGPAETHLGLQFRAHTIEREYLALVRGRARSQRLETYVVGDRGDGRRGSGAPEEGQRAITHVEVVEKLGDFTLVACRLETGRTHQVRIHLGEQGTPLCGERVYDRPLNGQPKIDTSGAARPLLHATLLSFEHPATGERVSWRAKLPRDMEDILRMLRKKKMR